MRMPGTFAIPPPLKSDGRMKVSSAVWLAGSDESVLRRNDIVILNCGRGCRYPRAPRDRPSACRKLWSSLCARSPSRHIAALWFGRILVIEHDTLAYGIWRIRLCRHRSCRLSQGRDGGNLLGAIILVIGSGAVFAATMVRRSGLALQKSHPDVWRNASQPVTVFTRSEASKSPDRVFGHAAEFALAMQIELADETRVTIPAIAHAWWSRRRRADAAENRTDLLLFVDVFQEGSRIRAITPVPVLGGAARLRGVGNDHAFWAIDLGQAALQWNCPGGPIERLS